MKKTTVAIMTGISMITMAQPALAATIDGEGSADVEINGTIGKLDNTDPGEIIPEGTDEWINVVVDTATAFHTTTASGHKSIESADYQIENKSGRGVQVSLGAIQGEPKLVNVLSINGTVNGNTAIAPTPRDLVVNNSLTDLSNSGAWMTLGNKEGRLNIATDEANAFGNTATFNYTGETIADLPTDINEATTAENYTLTLKFKSIQADGVTVGV
ncbi:hypothetical protein [uncultured Vagococcus sp.]|uniref:hypothetical protein n=1 Tax=uncultured Vagococcus sp. TaxID=189676 RepID=UPI0028D4CDC4|nr:hypothetical protein [uncultured Vagococcus sp.]